jgi:hypothetical protein
MGRWALMDGDDAVFIVESRPDSGTVSLSVTLPDPLVVNCVQAEAIRTFIGSAIGDACPGPSS